MNKTLWIVFDWELEIVVGVYQFREHAEQSAGSNKNREIIPITRTI